MIRKRFLWSFAFGALVSVGLPCIWDKDTLGDELRGLPGAFDLVSGRWYTHAPEYYRQRVERLPGHLRRHPDDLPAYDDLAVAYERLRDRDRAIAVMEQKAAALRRVGKRPGADVAEQRYRYHANLGTFYAHSGRLAEAVVELEKAVALNPAAHFGRERFQIDLIRYVAAARQEPALWSRHNFLTFSNYQLEKRYWSGMVVKLSFSERIRRDQDRSKHRWTTFDAAYTAVAGMLRFGGIEGAELYRAAGDLFVVRRDLHLAWWSYRRAVERGHPAKAAIGNAIGSIERHWQAAEKAVGGVGPVPTPRLYDAVRAEARSWRQAFWTAEVAALTQGADPSAPDTIRKLVAAADRQVPRRRIPAPTGGSTRRRARSGDDVDAQRQGPGNSRR